MSDPIQEIKNKADILDLVSELLTVKRSGSSYVALCPFHNDSKPSMHISSAKGIYKCFACGAGGDVFKFWSEYYQKDFKETLKELAAKYGVELKEYDQEKTQEKNLLIRLHDLAAEFYHQKLLLDNKAQEIRDYLKSRKISTETIATFKLGYSVTDGYDNSLLIKHLKAKLGNIEDENKFHETLVKASLAYKTDDGRYIDKFRNRLMIPIFDERFRCIAFGARTLTEEDPNKGYNPKYINSAETDIYVKGNNLYGLNLAKENIRKKDYAVIVEGFFDVISLYQAGFKNAVANQGTALTTNQIRKLSKFTQNKKIYLCFDNDNAGQKATDAAAELINQTLAQNQYQLKVIKVPGGKDADEFIKEHSLEYFEELINNAPYYIDHKIDQMIAEVDLNDAFAKEGLVKAIMQYVNQIQKEIVRFEYIKKIAEKLQVPEIFLQQQLKASSSNPYQENKVNGSQKIEIKKSLLQNKNQGIKNIEYQLIVVFLKDKSFLERFLEEQKNFFSLEAKEILNLLIDVVFENPEINEEIARYDLLLEKLQEQENISLKNPIADIGFLIEQSIINSNLEEVYIELCIRLEQYIHKISKLDIEILMKKEQPGSEAWTKLQQEKLGIERKIQAQSKNKH